ncbi:hypothetical protein KP509_34G019700 [Ceratopteris richardii]|uniref:Laccase n=1 Tax=Ceratopteris richardii TaxID=49495 RepID=A0A8T2QJA1_CERRI|nr:hypothetical protein KP509_34G019700 [Ceratopteris richardii]
MANRLSTTWSTASLILVFFSITCFMYTKRGSSYLLVLCIIVLGSFAASVSANSHENPDGTTSHDLHFKIQYATVTRLCNGTKQILTVNGQFPGPSVYVRTGDHVNIKVSNHVDENVTIHWHGVRQLLSGWADGPAYITQCPLQPNAHYNHNFTVTHEQGTLFWHAHLGWQRGTLYGAFIILPKKGQAYPFPIQPKADFRILIGEWWNMQLNDVEAFGVESGRGYNISDAITINGQPGFLYRCSAEDATTIKVKKGETYLLRIINAAMNFQMYFQVAKHSLTVVATDASYAKPYTNNIIVLAPGQTADVLLTADQEVDSYVFGATVFSPADPKKVEYPNVTTTGLLVYEGAPQKAVDDLEIPSFPVFNDSSFALNYFSNLRSLNSEEYPSNVPQVVNRSLLFTVGYSFVECKQGEVCEGPGPGNASIGTNINNVTFVLPQIAIMQAYYEQLYPNSTAVKWDTTLAQADDTFEENFPSMPLFQYNYTAGNLTSFFANFGTKVVELDFNTNVQLVLQNTNSLFFESHPFHLHGYNFYVVGKGTGTYVEEKDSPNFNLVDPPIMNTVAVPSGGWAAIRFVTDNPGVWLMHCHFEMHTTWGMMMVFIVRDGDAPDQKLPPPPKDYPKC